MLWQVPDAALIGGAFVLDSRAKGEVTTIPNTINYVITGGYYEKGDNGGAQYKRVNAEPSHNAKFQSEDGTWWELFGTFITPLQLGAVTEENGGADSSNEIEATFEAAYSIGIKSVVFNGGTLLSNFANVVQPGDFEIYSEGGSIKGVAGGSPKLLYITCNNLTVYSLNIDGNMQNTLAGDPSTNGGDAAFCINECTGLCVVNNINAINTKYHTIKSFNTDNVVISGVYVDTFIASCATVYGGDNCVIKNCFAKNMLDNNYYETHVFNQSVSPAITLFTKSNKDAKIFNVTTEYCYNAVVQFTGTERPYLDGLYSTYNGFNVLKFDGTSGFHQVKNIAARYLGAYGIFFGGAVGVVTGSGIIADISLKDFSTTYQFGRVASTGEGVLYGIRLNVENFIFDNIEIATTEGIPVYVSDPLNKVVFNNLRCYNSTGSSGKGIVFNGSVQSLQLTNSYFENTLKSALFCNGTTNVVGGLISNNTFYNCSNNPGANTTEQALMYLGAPSCALIIENNNFGVSSVGNPLYFSSTIVDGPLYRYNNHVVKDNSGLTGTSNWRNGLGFGRTNSRAKNYQNYYSGNYALDFGNVANGASANVDVTINGINQFDIVSLNTYNLAANVTVTATYLSANTLRFTATNNSGGLLAITCNASIRVDQQYGAFGSAAIAGRATLVAGSVTVNNGAITNNDSLILSRVTNGGGLGNLGISARVAGTSFTISSSSGTDTSTVYWKIDRP